MAKTLEDQVQMLTRNIFTVIYGCPEHIIRNLLDDGYVFSLQFPNYKWKFNSGGNFNCNIFVLVERKLTQLLFNFWN